MSLTTISASRIFDGQLKKLSGEENFLTFEKFPNIGLSKTYNINKQVPDSAGTATAIFSGCKTNYGYVGMDQWENSLKTILGWSQESNKSTGFVTTTSVTHATPAALYANIKDRNFECDFKIPENLKNSTKDIARQLVENLPGNRINVILGGGKLMFGLKSEKNEEIKMSGSMENHCERNDSLNLVRDWLNSSNDSGANKVFVQNTEELLAVNAEKTDYLLGIFAENHLAYNLLRDKSSKGQPSLAEMTKKAISILNKSKNGFFLMVEGGRIDQAHHQNLARIALDEVLEFDKAIQIALDMIDIKETLIIVTADHSHSLTFNGYPERGADILGFANKPDISPYETLTYANGPGFWKHIGNNKLNSETRFGTWLKVENLDNRKSPLYQHLATFPLEDETHGGEDVPVYAIGPGSHLIRGVFEQTYIAHVMSYAACVGPSAHLNENCIDRNFSIKYYNSRFIYVFTIIIICLANF